MKIVLAVLMLLAMSADVLGAGPDVPRLAITSPERMTMKEDLGKENPKWNFVAGRWARRASGGRQVRAQTAETQRWAVALLEDRKFDDVDVAVRFRPISGKEDASGGIIFRARDAKNYFLVRANALENNFRLYTMVNGKRSTVASAAVAEPEPEARHRLRRGGTRPRVPHVMQRAA